MSEVYASVATIMRESRFSQIWTFNVDAYAVLFVAGFMAVE